MGHREKPPAGSGDADRVARLRAAAILDVARVNPHMAIGKPRLGPPVDPNIGALV
jgi:hypothetical protein